MDRVKPVDKRPLPVLQLSIVKKDFCENNAEIAEFRPTWHESCSLSL
jgi:hypothetical protein